ncbi:hypothetical protein SDC9_171900 [bioreactor metagenome]|uniref:Uncharacterized protein n=1 Tax=bioreactor metagenome TaxID=1076179 RepID=A0A645GC63_9ZZZZ
MCRILNKDDYPANDPVRKMPRPHFPAVMLGFVHPNDFEDLVIVFIGFSFQCVRIDFLSIFGHIRVKRVEIFANYFLIVFMEFILPSLA